MSLLIISYWEYCFKTQGARLGAIVVAKNGLEQDLQLNVLGEKNEAKSAKHACYPENMNKFLSTLKHHQLKMFCWPKMWLHKSLHPLIGVLKTFIHSLTKLLLVYKVSTETLVVNWNSLLLRFEISNQMLAHLTGALIHEDRLTYDDSKINIFSEKKHYFKWQENILVKVPPFQSISIKI